jgi:hypothetical protein
MPRYYFHLHGSGAADMDGQEFADDAAAIAEAKEVAGDLRIGRVNVSQERIVVKNARRETIHEEPL